MGGEWNAFGKLHLGKEDSLNNIRYPGQYYDREVGLYHNRHRDYDPAVGRYIQNDPLGLIAGPNRYVYSYASPISWRDPLGLSASQTIRAGAATGGRLGAILGPKGAAAGALLGGAMAGAAGHRSHSSAQSDTDSESCDPPSCDTQFSGYIKCANLRGYPYRSKHHALLSFGGVNYRTVAERPITGGPCIGSAGAGSHWNVKGQKGQGRKGSIMSCTCCRDTSSGPVLEKRFRAEA